MIAYIEDDAVDFEAFKRRIPDVERFVRLRDFLASDKKYDLVVCDLALPDAYGDEVLEEIKNLENVVILTGLADRDFEKAQKALNKKGFKHVLSKYFLKHHPEEFTAYIKSL